MNTDYRALCAELTDALDWINCNCNAPNQSALVERACAALAEPERLPTHDLSNVAPLLWVLWNHLGARSPVGQPIREYLGMGQFQPMTDAQMAAANQYRALLWNSPQPEPEGPTDEELESFLVDVACQNGDMYYADPRVLARAVLARWGRPSTEESSAVQPADGEVAELVALIRQIALVWEPEATLLGNWAAQLARAADLLERLSPPQPVPVSERLPGPEDCDAEGRCWWIYPPDFMELRSHATAESAFVAGAYHWLPAHALPLPGRWSDG